MSPELEHAFTSAFRGHATVWIGPDGDGHRVDAWTGRADESDQAILAHCAGATLDVGCGPGRMAERLAERGQVVLGIDVVPEAIFLTRERGASALLRDVFHRVPAEGRWETALLADGNIGIGGDPVALLRRVGEMLGHAGRVVVELAPHGTGLRVGMVRLQTDRGLSEPFPWAVLGADQAASVAAEAGFGSPQIHRHGARWFGVFVKAGRR